MMIDDDDPCHLKSGVTPPPPWSNHPSHDAALTTALRVAKT